MNNLILKPFKLVLKYKNFNFNIIIFITDNKEGQISASKNTEIK